MHLPARRLTIDEKRRPYPVSVANPAHFRWHDDGMVDARTVLTSGDTSLYCLDPVRREAIFVRVPSGTDLGAAPFLYQAQYDAATDLIAVGFDVLHVLADEAPDPGELLLLYSVGRCGSTLISRLLRATPGVDSLSEPDVYTQLVTARQTGDLTEDDVDALVRSCTRIICAGSSANVVAMKFRSFAIDLAASFGRHFPKSRAVFLYRDALGWATSTARAFGHAPHASDAERWATQDRLGLLLPLLAEYAVAQNRLLTPIEAMACHWVGLMRGAQARQATGAAMFGLRYHDLVTTPGPAVAALYAYAGLALPPDDVLDPVLAADSQAGTTIARDARDADQTVDADELARVIADLESGRPSPRLTGDTVLPGTWGVTA